MMRRSSSSAGTPDAATLAPGRVDSPPISRMSAPSSSIWRARATACSRDRNLRPSENESGVTFRIPMTRVRRPSASVRFCSSQKCCGLFIRPDCIIWPGPMRQLRMLCALCLLVILPAQAAPPKKASKPVLATQIEAIIRQPQMASAHWGIDVLDLTSGKVIYSLNPDHLFLPASNVKLLTTAAALTMAGPDYRFSTTVETSGKLDAQGCLLGDLVIVGRGDANISGRVLPYQKKTERTSPPTQILEELADQVVQKGVKIVDGDVVGDDTLYSAQHYGEGWAYDDLQWLDGAPVSALSLNDNVVFIKVHPGDQTGNKALVIIEPENTYYEVDNRIVTSAAGVTRKIGIHHDLGSSKVVIWGSIPLDDAGFSEAMAIDDPALFTADIFRGILEKRGITITGKTRAL